MGLSTLPPTQLLGPPPAASSHSFGDDYANIELQPAHLSMRTFKTESGPCEAGEAPLRTCIYPASQEWLHLPDLNLSDGATKVAVACPLLPSSPLTPLLPSPIQCSPSGWAAQAGGGAVLGGLPGETRKTLTSPQESGNQEIRPCTARGGDQLSDMAFKRSLKLPSRRRLSPGSHQTYLRDSGTVLWEGLALHWWDRHSHPRGAKLDLMKGKALRQERLRPLFVN